MLSLCVAYCGVTWRFVHICDVVSFVVFVWVHKTQWLNTRARPFWRSTNFIKIIIESNNERQTVYMQNTVVVVLHHSPLLSVTLNNLLTHHFLASLYSLFDVVRGRYRALWTVQWYSCSRYRCYAIYDNNNNNENGNKKARFAITLSWWWFSSQTHRNGIAGNMQTHTYIRDAWASNRHFSVVSLSLANTIGTHNNLWLTVIIIIIFFPFRHLLLPRPLHVAGTSLISLVSSFVTRLTVV